MKRILDVLHCRVEEILKSWAACLPVMGDKKSLFGEQMNGITVLLRTKYKNYLQAIVGKFISNVSNPKTFESYPTVKCLFTNFCSILLPFNLLVNEFQCIVLCHVADLYSG